MDNEEILIELVKYIRDLVSQIEKMEDRLENLRLATIKQTQALSIIANTINILQESLFNSETHFQ